MNAKEFIKQYGWGKSVVIVFESIGHGANTFYDTHNELYYGQINDIRVSVTELKQYVDAWELVQKFGGLKRAKRILKKAYMQFNTMVSVVWNDKPFQCTIEQLEKAIELVESVNV